MVGMDLEHVQENGAAETAQVVLADDRHRPVAQQTVNFHLVLDQAAAAGHFRNRRADFGNDPRSLPGVATRAVVELGQLAQQTLRVELAVGEPNPVGILEGELTASAGVIYNDGGEPGFEAFGGKQGVRVVECPAAAFLPRFDTGSEIPDHRLQPVLLVGEELADMDAAIERLFP